MLRKILSAAASRLKGEPYELDPAIPVSALLSVAGDRLLAMARCLFRGLVISTDPRRLVMLGKAVKIRNRRFITFGRGVTLGDHVFIDGLSSDGIHLGDGSSIGAYGVVKATGVLNDIGKGLRLGQHSAFDAFAFFGASGGIEIGSNVIGGQRVSFHAESHHFDDLDMLIRDQGTHRKGIRIEDNCWIGSCVTFLDGAHLSSGCVVGAGSVVRGQFPPNAVLAGVPAKLIKYRGAEAAIPQDPKKASR